MCSRGLLIRIELEPLSDEGTSGCSESCLGFRIAEQSRRLSEENYSKVIFWMYTKQTDYVVSTPACISMNGHSKCFYTTRGMVSRIALASSDLAAIIAPDTEKG